MSCVGSRRGRGGNLKPFKKLKHKTYTVVANVTAKDHVLLVPRNKPGKVPTMTNAVVS